VEALRHTGLKDASDYYRRAFKRDLNNFYSGLNALRSGDGHSHSGRGVTRRVEGCSKTTPKLPFN
jgi:hypothetical protein